MAGPIVTKFGVWLKPMKRCISHMHLSARAHVQMFPSVSYLGDGWTDCAGMWCVIRDQLAMMRFALLRGGMHLHVRMCAPLIRVSGTDGRIPLKFGKLLETN